MQNAKVKLRGFVPSDLEKVMEIEKTSFPKRKAHSKKYFKKLYQKYPEGFILAENKNEIVGYTIGQPKNDSTEIISLAVKPRFRQKGIGKKLINFLINYFKERGIKGILLHVRTENKTGVAFYRNLGFKILKTIKNYYRNGDDAYLMKK